MGIDFHLSPFVKSQSYSTEMDYPSTTQALFALVVMIIVLLFILVYCCSGAFPCNNSENNTTNPDPTGRRIQNPLGSPNSRTPGSRSSEDNDIDSSGQRTVVIVPLNGMIYYREQNSERIFQIPTREKPPAYSDVFNPPPPYSIRTVTPSPTNDCVHPPAYEESFRDWKLTLDNDNRFDSHLTAFPDARTEPLSQTINDLINEATFSISARAEGRNADDTNVNVFSPVGNEVPGASHISIDLEPPNPAISHQPTPPVSSDDDQATRSSLEGIDQETLQDLTSLQSGIRRNSSNEVVLRVPDADVYSLIRDVTVAETSRRDADTDNTRQRQELDDSPS